MMVRELREEVHDGRDQHAQSGRESDERLMLSLPEGHIIRLLMEEHIAIGLNLDQLEKLADRLEQGEDRAATLEAMSALGARLVASEPHHTREEKVLFPRLFDLGISGPPMIMSEEHLEIRRLKQVVADDSRFAGTRAEIDCVDLIDAVRSLVAILRAHILKENRILYPMALGVIRGDSEWEDMRAESDLIGPCRGVSD